MTLRRFAVSGLLLTLIIAQIGQAKTNYQPPSPLSPEQAALVQKAIAAEKVIIEQIQRRSPLIQTYIQNMRPDQRLYAVPESDQYFFGRVDFGRSFKETAYAGKGSSKHGFFRGSLEYVSDLTRILKMQYTSAGFMDMMFLDPVSFDQQHYDFGYVRRDFLGAVRTLVFDVHPKPGTGSGRFTGRIWIEDQGGNIVRFNGTYTPGNEDDDGPGYFHFDSWRENLQPGLWLPVGVYVEETQGSSEHPVSFRAQTSIWGYELKLPAHGADHESVKIDNVQDLSDQSQDLSPLAAQQRWFSEAEEVVLDRMVQAGLLAPPSDFDKVLEQISNNIIVGNNIEMTGTIHCRVLLTAPLESLAVGNTIILSKGLIDVLPSEADLAAVLSFQLAHIVLGHHIGSPYAFNARLRFLDKATFERAHLSHSEADNESASGKAIELLSHSVYAPQLAQPGLFLAQLNERSRHLVALNTPLLGDSLLRPTGEPWLNALMSNTPELNLDKLDQISALPLGTQLKIDAWDDKVLRLHTRIPPVLLAQLAQNKMPFEIARIHSRLTRYGLDAPEVASLDWEPGALEQGRGGQASESGRPTSGESASVFEKRLVRIFFATDRARGSNLNGVQEFTGARAPDDSLVFGSAEVSIPPGHITGVLEGPSWIHLRVRFDKSKDITVTSVSQLPPDEFLNSLDQQVRSDPKHQALVFVHGYNVSFDDAARRLAQITYDLGFPGASILYSWPSEGSLFSYLEDEGNEEWSGPHFLGFLEMLQRDKQIDTIDIISHSMGSRLVTSAFETLSEKGQRSNPKLGAVVMAAPDVDVGVFSRFANAIHQLVPRVAIYESSNDTALMISHRFHHYPRLGDTDPTVHVFQNYECIEATAVDTSLLGHSYIGDNPSILADVFDLIMAAAPAGHRFRLQERSLDGLPYWAFRK